MREMDDRENDEVESQVACVRTIEHMEIGECGNQCIYRT